MHRRDLLRTLLGSVGVAACGTIGLDAFSATPEEPFASPRKDGVSLTAAQWREILMPEEFRILREAGTERAFTSDLLKVKDDGVFACAGCGLPLYDSKTKFDSGTGWPSFWAAIGKDRIVEKTDRAYGMLRTELVCARCGGHQGHVFPDGPAPTGMRHCINGESLDFVDRATAKKLAKDPPVVLGGFDGPHPALDTPAERTLAPPTPPEMP